MKSAAKIQNLFNSNQKFQNILLIVIFVMVVIPYAYSGILKINEYFQERQGLKKQKEKFEYLTLSSHKADEIIKESKIKYLVKSEKNNMYYLAVLAPSENKLRELSLYLKYNNVDCAMYTPFPTRKVSPGLYIRESDFSSQESIQKSLHTKENACEFIIPLKSEVDSFDSIIPIIKEIENKYRYSNDEVAKQVLKNVNSEINNYLQQKIKYNLN